MASHFHRSRIICRTSAAACPQEEDPAGAIFSIMQQHAYRTGQLLPPAEIAATLQEEWEARLDRLPEHEATRKRLNLAPPAPTDKPSRKKKPGRPSGDTEPDQSSLSSDMPPSKGPKKKPKSRDEQIRFAAKELDAELWEPLDGEDDFE